MTASSMPAASTPRLPVRNRARNSRHSRPSHVTTLKLSTIRPSPPRESVLRARRGELDDARLSDRLGIERRVEQLDEPHEIEGLAHVRDATQTHDVLDVFVEAACGEQDDGHS